MPQIILIRHGQTDWNREGRYQGKRDVPLNAAGLEQAAQLAELLARQRFTAIFSSPLQRARVTAEIIARRLGLPVILEPRLREIDQGDWEGRLLSEVRQEYADIWQQQKADPTDHRAPGGESVREVAQRMAAAANEIACLHPHGQVLIVSHGLALATLYCQAEGIPLAEVYQHIPHNAQPLTIHWSARVPFQATNRLETGS